MTSSYAMRQMRRDEKSQPQKPKNAHAVIWKSRRPLRRAVLWLSIKYSSSSRHSSCAAGSWVTWPGSARGV